MEIIGYISALLIGLSLGMIGSGGTILALPIFVYLFGIKDMQVATHYTMFVVGITAFIGAFRKYQEDMVEVKTAISFFIPSLLSFFFTRKIILPILPNNLFQIGHFTMTKDIFLLILFAIVMFFSSFSMLRDAKQEDLDCFAKKPNPDANPKTTTAVAIIVGMLTALVGAGGGFLIIPSLILLKDHCMRRAIGTSLVIITVNSLVGFVGDFTMPSNWGMLLIFSTIAIVGMLLGISWSERIKESNLKRLFAVMVLVMGFFIILKELFL